MKRVKLFKKRQDSDANIKTNIMLKLFQELSWLKFC